MIQVAFHTKVADKFGYACRLVRKAYRSGARVTITAPDPVLQELDKMLWTFDAVEFLPHRRRTAGDVPEPGDAATPIWLVASGDETVHHDVLLNMGVEVTTGFESFERVVELISLDEADVHAGRKRWKHYADRGYPLIHHVVTA